MDQVLIGLHLITQEYQWLLMNHYNYKNQASELRKIQFQINHDLKDAYKCLISSIGIIHKFYNPLVEFKIEQITSTSVIVSVRSDLLSQLQYIKFNVILGNNQALRISTTLGVIIDSTSLYPFVYKVYSEVEETHTINFPPK